MGENYETHKLGLIRLYLFTKTLTSDDDPSQETDRQTDDRHESTTDSGQDGDEVEEGDQFTQNTSSSENEIHTVKDNDQGTATPSAVVSPVAFQFIDLPSLGNTSGIILGPLTGGPFLGHVDDPLLHEPIIALEEEQINSYTSTPIDTGTASTRPASPSVEVLNVTVKLHRVALVEELIAQFKDEALMSYSVKYSSINEMGADADGVSTDVYAAFWTEFLDCAAEGADVRVPSRSPKWQEEEWESVGRILAKGLKDHGYFPFRLAQAFTAAVVFGEHSVSTLLLFDSLMLYFSQSERDLLSRALQEAVVGDDEEELLDLMDRMGVKTIATNTHLRAALIQVAHKQMIQRPKYALDNIAQVARSILGQFSPSVEDMKKLYEDIKPTTRKVIQMITASPANSAENQSLQFFPSVHTGTG